MQGAIYGHEPEVPVEDLGDLPVLVMVGLGVIVSVVALAGLGALLVSRFP